MNKNYNKFSLLLILITLLMLKSNVLSAEYQSTTYLGGYINYNYHMHSVKDSFSTYFYAYLPPQIIFEPTFTKGTGSGVDLGGLFERRLNSDFSIGFTIGAALGEINFIADTFNIYFGEVVNVESFFEPQYFDLKFYTINLTPYVTYNIYKGLFASLGLNVGFVMHSNADSRGKFTIINAGYRDFEFDYNRDILYLDGGRSFTMVHTLDDFNTDADYVKKIQIGLPIGLGYNFHIGNGVIFSPSIRYNLALTSFSDKRERASEDLRVPTDWIANKLEVCFAIKFPTGRINEEVVEDDIINDESNLSADLNIYGIDTNGNRISNPTLIIEEVETDEYFPLLSIVYFKEGSSSLSDTRVELLEDIDVGNFREENLPKDAIAIHYNALNIIANRMHNNKDTKITVVGYSNDNESSELALERANTVKDYLVNTWSIVPNKITVKTDKILDKSTSPDAIEESSRVEIVPTDLSSYILFSPINLSFVDKVSNPPMVEFEPKIEADAGLNNLVLDISQNDNNIRQFNKNNTSNILWTVKDVEYDTPLDITLLVRDLNNKTVEVDKNISIENITIKEKKATIEGNYKVERYSLILFEYDKSEVSKIDVQNIKNIKSHIQSNSKVLISGFADRNGNRQYNQNLAKRRCEEVRKVIGIKNAIIRAIGNDNLLFDNSFPEGRALSRTVRIEIRTPIK